MASIRKNLAYNFILSASQVLLPLISIPYISRVLDPEGIGKVSFIDSFTWYFISVAEFGIVVYGMREIARVKEDAVARTRLVSELLVLHMVSSAITLVLYFASVWFVWDKIRDVRLLLFSLSFLLVNFFACEWYFLGMERFKYITLRSLLSRGLGLISIFILIQSPDDYFLYYAIIAGSAIVNSIWNNYVLFTELKIRFRQVNWKQHVRHTRITYLINLTYGITLFLDNVLLRFVSTAAAVAFYAFSMKIVRTFGMLLTDSLLVFFPRIVALHKENNTVQLKKVVLDNLRLLIFFAVPVSTGMFLVAEPLIRVFLGEQFMPAVKDLQLLAFFPLLRSYNLFLSKQVLISHNKERLYLTSLTWGSLLFVGLTLLLSYYYADAGACYALLAAEAVILGMNFYFARKTAPSLQLFEGRAFGQACISAGLMVPLVIAVQSYGSTPLVSLLLSAGAGALLYLMVQVFVMRNAFFTHSTGEKAKTYFIQEYLLEKLFHGGIGNVDIEKVLIQNGVAPIVFPCHHDFSLKAKLLRLRHLFKVAATLPSGSTIFFQYPFYSGMTRLLLRILQYRKSITVVCIIADINGLKHGNASLLQREARLFRRYGYFIVHNGAMQRWLDSVVPGNRSAQLQFFDFLATVPPVHNNPGSTIVFAGNLEKSSFLEKLHAVTAGDHPLVFHIYGQPVSAAIQFSMRIVYKGVFEPYQLPQKIEGNYGLVWDGEGVEEPAGSMGRYMEYITHHKVSLYILCGLPLIVWEQCGSAALVREYNIGITVRNLFEIKEKIAAITEIEYREMSRNTRSLAQRITDGSCTTAAFRQIMQMIEKGIKQSPET